jgi:hypothetical protein
LKKIVFFIDTKIENSERMKLANLAAQAAERRLSLNKTLTTVNNQFNSIT